MSLIRMENVSKVYRTNGLEFPAVKEVSFSVAAGEFLSIAGPSGSGKTTLLNIMGCLDQPSGGKYWLEENDIAARKSVELAEIRRYSIGFIFQTFNLIPVMTAYENVEFPLLLKSKGPGKTNPKDRQAVVEKILTEVGLNDFMHRKPMELSGGQQQRVAIARALVKKPHLVLADEPTANLDSKTGKEILELMMQLNQKFNATFIFSTHDKMVMDFGRRLIRLEDGRIAADEKRG